MAKRGSITGREAALQSSTWHSVHCPLHGVNDGQLAERLVITLSMDGMETALNPMKYRELSNLHTFDISIPTVEDPALAPPDNIF